MNTMWHFYNYARVNSQNIGMHIGAAHVVWQHCRRGVLSPGGATVHFTCRYVDNKGKGGFITSTYPWIPTMARGMIIRGLQIVGHVTGSR